MTEDRIHRANGHQIMTLDTPTCVEDENNQTFTFGIEVRMSSNMRIPIGGLIRCFALLQFSGVRHSVNETILRSGSSCMSPTGSDRRNVTEQAASRRSGSFGGCVVEWRGGRLKRRSHAAVHLVAETVCEDNGEDTDAQGRAS